MRGDPLYNLEVKITLDPITFDRPVDLARNGDLLIFTQTLFEGEKCITSKGYILSGSQPFDLNNRPLIYKQAILNFNANYEALSFLGGVLKKKVRYATVSPLVKLQYASNEVQFVKAEGSHLYLPLVREALDLKRLIK